MGAIRGDFVGEVWVTNKDGENVVLRAGDTIPAGVEVGDDLLAVEKSPKPASKSK